MLPGCAERYEIRNKAAMSHNSYGRYWRQKKCLLPGLRMGRVSCRGSVPAILKKERKERGKCSLASEKCVGFGRREGNGQHHPVSCLAFANLRLLVSLKCDLFPCCTGKERRENKSCVALKSERALRPSQCQDMALRTWVFDGRKQIREGGEELSLFNQMCWSVAWRPKLSSCPLKVGK